MPSRHERRTHVGEESVPVDLLNPGQVFACIGLMEASLQLHGPACAAFDWSRPEQARFVLSNKEEDEPIHAVFDFLRSAEVHSLAPIGSDLTTDKWSVPTRVQPNTFPIPEPPSPATLPAVLQRGDDEIRLFHWGDGSRRRDKVKFWAGSGGYPGAGLLRDSLQLASSLPDSTTPFDQPILQSSSFRFDWRRDYIPIDSGFSLNEHAHIGAMGYPLVEILAAIGLSHARPKRLQDKLHYRYGVIGRSPDSPDEALLPPALLRAALGGTFQQPFSVRRFSMNLGWPGQEGQARCITSVSEEIA